MGGHNASDDYDEGAGGATNLSLRAAEQGDQKSGDHGAVNSSLGTEAGGDGKCHRQRQRDQADRDSGHQVVRKLVEVIAAQTEDRLRKPTLFKDSTFHGCHYVKKLGVCR